MKISKIAVVTLFVFSMAFAGLGVAQDKPAPAQEILVVMDLQVKPGMGLEWENYLKKDLLPAFRKGGIKELNIIESEFGPDDLYSMWWSIKNLAELDNPNPFYKALGPEGRRGHW